MGLICNAMNAMRRNVLRPTVIAEVRGLLCNYMTKRAACTPLRTALSSVAG